MIFRGFLLPGWSEWKNLGIKGVHLPALHLDTHQRNSTVKHITKIQFQASFSPRHHFEVMQ